MTTFNWDLPVDPDPQLPAEKWHCHFCSTPNFVEFRKLSTVTKAPAETDATLELYACPVD